MNNQANPVNNKKYGKEDAYKTLDMVNAWITNVDTKVSYSLTFIGILLGFFLTGSKPINLNVTLNKVFYKGIQVLSLKEILILILIAIFTICSVVAIIYLYNALKGRIEPKVYKEDKLITSSLIFWGTISKKLYTDFYNSISSLNEENLIKDISSQIFINSKICTQKVESYNKGVKYIVISVIVYFIYRIIGCIMI